MREKQWARLLLGLAITTPIPYVAFSQTYLTEAQAANALFPGIKLKPSWRDLNPAEIKKIEKASDEKVRDPHVRVLWGPHGEALIIDQVLGKHEYITYAVAIKKNGQVKGIEILDYRETYGYEVRQQEWRNQFIGKDVNAPLKLDKDISNISGATLSSAHVTNGVRRVLNTYAVISQKA